MTDMTKERQGEIARMFLKQKMREEGVRLTPNLRRQIGNTAKTLEIPFPEAVAFAEIIVREMVEETFAESHLRLL